MEVVRGGEAGDWSEGAGITQTGTKVVLSGTCCGERHFSDDKVFVILLDHVVNFGHVHVKVIEADRFVLGVDHFDTDMPSWQRGGASACLGPLARGPGISDQALGLDKRGSRMSGCLRGIIRGLVEDLDGVNFPWVKRGCVFMRDDHHANCSDPEVHPEHSGED